MNSLKKFFPLYFTNVLGVLNDNMLKTLVCFVCAGWVAEEYKTFVVNFTTGAMVLPYMLFSPFAGKLPHYFKKTRIVKAAKILELPIMMVAVLGFEFQNLTLALTAVTLMGLQSALFSPSKYGLIKDIGGQEGISAGMGGMEAFAFIGILTGTFLGSVMSESFSKEIQYGILISVAVLGLLCSFFIKADETFQEEVTSANPVKFLRETYALVAKHRGLKHVIYLLSLYWWLSGSIQTLLILHCDSALSMSPADTGIVLALMAVGISTGCVICGNLDRKKFMLALVPQTGFVIAALLVLICVFDFKRTLFTVAVVAVAVLCGFFKIPMDAEIQKRAKAGELNVFLAYFNLISFIFIFLSAVTNILITSFMPTKYVFLFDGIVIFVSSLVFLFNYKSVLCKFVSSHINLHYDVKMQNVENMTVKDGENLLVLPMHRAILDPIMLFSMLRDKKFQPLVDSRFWDVPVIGHILNMFDAVQVPDLRKGRKGVEQVQHLDGIIEEQLKKGANILFYPSGHITLDGRETIGNRRLAYNAAQILPEKTKVVGVRILGFWGSKWSNYNRKKTPPILKLLLMSAAYIYSGLVFFKKKREIRIEFYDITEDFRRWKSLSRQDFNKNLEKFYNGENEYEKLVLTH
jgi:acyl-[acyl-carrier-protein]-phospholipid O-acyltransferase/long-chain-fatty-acid--[acyl-carrier-protein] ligase